MIKQIACIKAKQGLTRDDFISHYENVHAPLSRSLFPMFSRYQRNFLDKRGAISMGFDVIAEMWFANKEDYAAFIAKVTSPEVRKILQEDEDTFIDIKATKAFTVEEFET
jgi:hypothetical protein